MFNRIRFQQHHQEERSLEFKHLTARVKNLEGDVSALINTLQEAGILIPIPADDKATVAFTNRDPWTTGFRPLRFKVKTQTTEKKGK